MDPQEWQRLAAELAIDVTDGLDTVEREFWPEPLDPTFRAFWPRLRALEEKVRTAPAIDIEVKLQLQARMRNLSRRAHGQQDAYFAEMRSRRAALVEAVQGLRSAMNVASKPEELRQIRQNLVALRDQFNGIDLSSRTDRQELWKLWQSANQEVWERLNGMWAANEQGLRSILDQARARLNAGDVKGTRDLIKRFNAVSRELEAPHKSGRPLRAQANAIWQEAAEVARAKHESYMATAGERLDQWKTVQGRNARAIASLRAEIAALEERGGETEVAAAFTRALVEDKMREIERLESTNESLHGRIENIETALEPVS